MAGTTLTPQGIIAPLLTPFDQQGAIDTRGAANLVQWLVDRKVVSSVFCRSGMGQMFTFSVADVKALVPAVVEAAAGRLTVFAGCAGEWQKDLGEPKPDPKRYLAQSIELALFAQEHGADAAVFVMPQALSPEPGRPLEDTIFDYFAAIAQAVTIPQFIYMPPGLDPEYNMTPSLLKRLLAIPSIRGMKVSTNKDEVWKPLAAVAQGVEHFSMIAGAEHYYLEALKTGARGCIGGGCMTHPEMIYAIGYYYAKGDLAAAEQAAADTLSTLRAQGELKIDGRVAGKMYIASKGYPCQPYRRPPGGTLPTAEQLAAYADLLDSRVAPYREAVEQGRMGR